MLRPTDEAALTEAIAGAAANSTPLAVQAGGSKAALGHAVDGVVLDVGAFSGIVEYDPAELVLTAKAATPLQTVIGTLAQRGQHLGFEPADYARLLGANGAPTLGGTLAANVSGPRRIAAGAARDHFLGVHAVSGRGERFKSGGRVIKNVTGYDLAKLLAGSFGTLAVMTEVTVKVMPAPEDARTVLVRGQSAAAAVELMTRVTGLPLDISGLAHLGAPAAARSSVRPVATGGAAVTALRLEGIPASVADRAAKLRDVVAGEAAVLERTESQSLWGEIRDGTLLPPGVVWRLSVPPASGAEVGARIARQIDCEVLYDWAGGLLWLTLPGDAPHAEVVRGAFAGVGGHATLIRAPAAAKQRCAVFQPLDTAVAALGRRVKDAFDPAGILNPGRMVA